MADHKIVFKNTLFLYFRILLSMVIGLYASRVILEQLGVNDFGIFSVVASLTMLFNYLNYGISMSLQRVFSCEIALDSREGLQKCFSSSLIAITLLAVPLVILAETLGLWALKTVIDIPAGREADAFFVYQMSVGVLVVELYKACCQSLIIAYEKMSFFAYISVIEALLKLGVIFLLIWIPGDKLRIYSLLLLGVSLLVLTAFATYCRRNFPHVHFILRRGSERLREIFSFMGWNTLASFAELCYLQGTNIVINVFYGVAYNATMGITNQVKNAVYAFSRNLQTAANPHLIKEYAQEEYKSFSSLAMTISVVSFMLLYVIGVPIIMNTNYILNLWLTTIPPDASTFIRLILVFCLVDSLMGPLWVGMQAYGRIRNYQLIITAVMLLSIPGMWFVMHLGAPPAAVLVVQIGFNLLLLSIRLVFAHKFCHIRITAYFRDVVLRIIAVIAFTIIFLAPVALMPENFGRLVVSLCTGLAATVTGILTFGLPRNERQAAKAFILKKLHRTK